MLVLTVLLIVVMMMMVANKEVVVSTDQRGCLVGYLGMKATGVKWRSATTR